MTDIDISNLKFLILDKNQFMRKILRDLLRSFHVRTIKEVNDGGDGLKELRSFKPDIILTEWEMRPIDGIEFARIIRNSQDVYDRFVPIIMVTAHSQIGRIKQARDSGINEFLVKPISARALYSRITSLIENPRAFVEMKLYSGPDRRRHKPSVLGFPERREPTDIKSKEELENFVASSGAGEAGNLSQAELDVLLE
jgi:two-component system chemotaxis response regulator CheY